MASFFKRPAVAFLYAAALCWPSLAPGAETIDLLLAHDQSQVPPNTHIAAVSEEFRRLVAKSSDGRIRIDILPNAMLGGNYDVAKLVDKNVLSSALVPLGAAAKIYPPLRASLIPFSFESIDTARKVFAGPYKQKLREGMVEKSNLFLVGFVDVGGFDILTNIDREILLPEDMWGLNIASIPDLPELDSMIKASGAKAVKVSINEKFNLLYSHALDGQMGTIDLALAQGMPSVQGHATLTEHLYAPYVWLFSKSALDGLGPDDRGLLLKSAEDALRTTLDRIQALEKSQAPLKKLRQSVTVHVPTPEERRQFSTLMQPAAEEAILDSLGPQGAEFVSAFKAAIQAAERSGKESR
ncbi:MAG: TRAP transporter substrate-binding protein DctP [Alphaproteobacteria bacterium]|nr:TRAP transporter substrate-binding protein DctP [Alphaproteobacteria bacterium]